MTDADNLETLGHDWRFRAILGRGSCEWTLWVFHVPDASALQVMYSWLVPSPAAQTAQPDSRWVHADVKGGAGPATARGHRLSLAGPFIDLLRLVRRFGDGEALGDLGSDGLPPSCQTIRVADANTNAFARTEVLYLEPRGSLSRNREALRSPMTDAPAFSCSMARVDKTAIWTNDAGIVSSNADAMLNSVAQALDSETPFDFHGPDFKRLGNIEVIAPVTGAAVGRPLVDVNLRDAGTNNEQLTMSLDESFSEFGDTALVRCRVFGGPSVVEDALKIVNPIATGCEFKFASGLGSILVEVFARRGKRFDLVWSNHVSWIREIRIGMGLMGMSGRVESDWTKHVSDRYRKRVSALQAIQQVSHEVESRVGTGPAPWIGSFQTATELATRLFPRASSSKFFSQGIGHPDGRLAFGEWFKRHTERPQRATILLLDPYFDSESVEFFATAAGTQHDYVVVTNTAQRHEQDRQSAEPRDSRIRNSCRNATSLHTLSLRIHDVMAGKPRFHDRYLVIYGEEAGQPKVEVAYQLSNSVHTGTRRFPLLVTEIPADVTPDVDAYVRDVLATCEEIWSTQEHRESIRAQRRAAPAVEPDRVDTATLGSLDTEAFAVAWWATAHRLAHSHQLEDDLRELSRLDGLVRRLKEFIEGAPSRAAPIGTLDLELEPEAKGLGHYVTEEFGVAIRTVRWIVERPLLGHTSYAVHFAAELLTTMAPDALAASVATLESATREDGAKANNAILGTILGVLSAAGPRLIRARDLQLARAMLRGNSRLLRAITASVLSQPGVLAGEVGPEARLQCVEELNSKLERLQTYAEFVAAYRVVSNRTRHETVETENALSEAAAAIKRNWISLEPKVLTEWILRLGGPGRAGHWARSSFVVIINPLVEDDKLKLEDARDAFVGSLLNRVDRLVGTDPGSEQFGPGDADFTDFCAALIAATDGSTHVDRIARMTKKATRVLRRPFSSSQNYSRWDSARAAAEWLKALTLLLLEHVGPDHASYDVARRTSSFLEDTARFVTPMDETTDPTGLARFSRLVAEAIQEKKREEVSRE